MTATTIANLTTIAAASYGAGPALVDDDTTLTWSEVESRVTHLAANLVSLGIEHGERVVVSTAKSVLSHITFHALLRIGAVVVPIDPRAPASQAADIANLARSSVVIADAAVVIKRGLAAESDRWRLMISATGECEGAESTTATLSNNRLPSAQAVRPPTVEPHHEAYIIFTSGSTGQPKGIVHTHASAVAYAHLAKDAHDLTEHDVLAGLAPLHFDMSTLELYAAPLAGSTVAPVPDSVLKFPSSVVEHSRKHSATVWYLVPTLSKLLVERGGLKEHPVPSLRLVVYAGESYPPTAVQELMDAVPDAAIQNAFGPAETNVVSVFAVNETTARLDAIPIGEPWPGARFDLVRLDESAGADGALFELWLAGSTMMAGYLGRSDLTASRMRTDSEGTAWYQTGDIVRKTEHGVVFVGRGDHQVKVRGVRLELEAIEAAIEKMPGVRTAVAMAVPPSNPEGVEVVVLGDSGIELTQTAVRRHAALVLNPAAVPSIVHFVDELPQTQSGKLDRSRVRAAVASLNSAVSNASSRAPSD
ncbi:MAG: D-alanine--poly(phosphoribitol) ligase [Actinobacteria bacterium]|nr:D-alanine--poly(phosphoribitol) ligase [Actinomycetota bacterium]